MMYSKKKNSFKKSTADKWFSIYIRLRDSYNGYATCITCQRLFLWKEVDCGHYMDRGKPMTRFNEQNAHAQCKACNRFRSGEQSIHGKMIDKKYGLGTSEKLINLSRIRGQKIHTKTTLKEIAREYRIKAKKMAEEKCVEL